MMFFICMYNVFLYYIYLVLIRKFGIVSFKNLVFFLNVFKSICMFLGGYGLNILFIKEKLFKYVKGGMYNINKLNICIIKKKKKFV